MEYVELGDSKNHITPQSIEKNARVIARQLLEALKFCMGIIGLITISNLKIFLFSKALLNDGSRQR